MKKFALKSLVAVVLATLLGVFAYNHFALYRFKWLLNLDLKALQMPPERAQNRFAHSKTKCDFNPYFNAPYLAQDAANSAQNGTLNSQSELKNAPQSLANSDFLIAHAGGGLIVGDEKFSYTNSKEALLQSISEGFKFIELDLMLDIDGDIFAAHDYEHFYGITGAKFTDKTALQRPPSKDYIRKARIYGRFSPLEKDEINEIFLANPSVYLVTDKLNDFTALSRQLKFKDRLLVEVFSTQNYFKALKMGFKYPMFCVWDSADALKEAMRLDIAMITANTRLLQSEQGEKLAREYIENGGCIMAFSSNEKAFIDKHKNAHATAFYTDFYDIKNGKCKIDDEGECKTY